MVMVVFGQSARFDFINFDDDQYVTRSPLTQLGLSREGVTRAWTESQVGNWHPLTTMSFMLDWHFFGSDPRGYHIHNVILHAAAAVVLFLALQQLTASPWLSFLTAALFALHPLRAESVAWVSERKDVLSGLYFMLTLWVYALYTRKPSRRGYLFVVAAFTLGLMSKAMLVTLPAVLLLLDFWPLGRWRRLSDKLRERHTCATLRNLIVALKLAGEKWLLFAISGLFSLLTAHLSLSADRVVDVLPLSVRLAMAPVSYVTYLGQLCFPAKLAAHYPYSTSGPPAWQVVGACTILIAISTAAWLLRKQRPYLLMGWLWFLITTLPIIGLIPGGNQLIADRYTYLTQIGLSIAVVWTLGDFCMAGSARRKHIIVSGAAIAILMLSLAARRQTAYWKDSETLWRHALAATSANAIAHEKLADALNARARESTQKQNPQEANALAAEAKTHYGKALEIAPRQQPSLCNLGVILHNEGKPDEAIALLRKAIAINPRLTDAHYNLGNALLTKKDIEAAMASYRDALAITPRHAPANNNLANLLADQGALDEAISLYRTALEVEPRNVSTRNNLAGTLAKKGDWEEAIATFHRSLEIAPRLPRTWRRLGDLYRERGDFELARTQYEKSLELDPGNVIAWNNLGDILQRMGITDRAIDAYRKGVKLAPGNPVIWYNLGYCLGESHEKEAALQAYHKALELAEKNRDHASAELVRSAIRQLASP
jgi:tetratricopeptide (TPR) repeat protein